MMAILLVIISFRTIVKSRSVQILSDNITSIAYVNHKVGSYPVSNSFTKNHINLNRRGQQWDVHSTRAYCRSQKPCSRLLVAYSRKAQLDASPQTLFLHRSNIEPSNNRQICTLSQYKTPSVQQSLKLQKHICQWAWFRNHAEIRNGNFLPGRYLPQRPN